MYFKDSQPEEKGRSQPEEKKRSQSEEKRRSQPKENWRKKVGNLQETATKYAAVVFSS